MYPILLQATPHSYGAIGLAWAILVMGLLGAGWFRLGLLMLGLSIAVHASTGVWSCVFVGLAAVLDPRLWPDLRRRGLWAGAGLALSALSLVIHVLNRPPALSVATDDAERYFFAFVSSWDSASPAASVDCSGRVLQPVRGPSVLAVAPCSEPCGR